MTNKTAIALWAALTVYNYCCYVNTNGTGWFIFSFILFAYSAYRFVQLI
jgi:hypothetical protein